VNNMLERVWEERVVPHFKVLSHHLLEKLSTMTKNLRTAILLVEIQIWDPNVKN